MGDKGAEKATKSGMPSNPSWENFNHPLYLHHSDQPGAILVSQPLVEDNYNTWAQSMNMALAVKNKIGLVDGTIEEPTEKDELLQWNRCNNLVKTWLLGSMSKEIAGSVINCKSARNMWLDLQERFSHANTVQLFHVENEIHDCVQGNMSVSSYYTELKKYWDDRDTLCPIPACNCGSSKQINSYRETQKTMKFLMGLNDSFTTVRSNILLLDPLPPVNKAYALVIRQEKQTEVYGKVPTQPEAAVFAVKNSNRELNIENSGLKCGKCHKTNHSTENCRAHQKCTYCGWKGHLYEFCRKRKNVEGERTRFKGNQVSASVSNRKEEASYFPFSQEECKQLLNMLNKSKVSMVNQVGNNLNHDEISGPTFGEDDWDGN